MGSCNTPFFMYFSVSPTPKIWVRHCCACGFDFPMARGGGGGRRREGRGGTATGGRAAAQRAGTAVEARARNGDVDYIRGACKETQLDPTVLSEACKETP